MPSAFRQPKTLPDWIQLDYFRRPRALRRWRGALGWGTFLVFMVAVAGVLALPRGKTVFQAGPLSAAHAMFNNDCGQCHTDAFQTAKRLWPTNSGIHAVSDAACEQCHAGPPHNAKQLTAPGCADCHREHRGRLSLVRVPDENCTSCHANLPANSQDGTATVVLNVSAFAADKHPEFRLWRQEESDPGQLRFNHQAHLRPEGIRVAGGGTEVLDCSACHRTDSVGRYMQPIRYEAHCQRCHPLTVQLTGDFADAKLANAVVAFSREPAPHREAKVVRATLRERLLIFAREHGPQAEAASIGRAIPRPPRRDSFTELQWNWAKNALTEMESKLFADRQLPEQENQLFDQAGGCAYCHVPTQPRGTVDLPEYQPTHLPERWFQHSRFRHDAHRMLLCTECHPAAASAKTSDVLMPRIGQCLTCHSSGGGARGDCVECHGYHDHALQVDPPKGRSLAEIIGR